jgi:uncharacterized Zn-binding protein involved in type VI secretion
LGDKARGTADAHGCPACPHPTIGPIIGGSASVNINGRPAGRLDDPGIHAACCGPNTWNVQMGSATVFINGKPAARINDSTKHCGGVGQIIEGSPDVIIGGAPSSGGGGSGGGGSGGAGSGGAGREEAGGRDGVAGGSARIDAGGGAAAATGGAGWSAEQLARQTGSVSAGSGPEQEPQFDDDLEEVTFRVLDPADERAVAAGVTVLVEFPDGTRRSLDTDDQGEVKIRHAKGAAFKLVEINARHLHSKDTQEG